ncbi:MAG TPA: electron transfer flavoprotein beta subunit/FixA family protein [Anaerolineae bacterium]|nr:electron transfer flavoprotein beta subunit/FixA family protein [Anaerolineae bacterium]
MRYLVCIKQTPDTAELPKVSPEEAASGNLSVNLVVNPWDEHAIEGGLQLMENYGGTTGAITVGGEGAIDALRSALAMGCKDATLVQYEGSTDALNVADLLAAAIKNDGDVDVVVMGQMTVDGNTGLTPVVLGRKLGWPVLTGVAKVVELTEDSITVERSVGQSRITVKAPTPVVLSVVKEIGEPRYPTFINIRKAARVKIPVLTPEDLGVDVPEPKVHMANFRKPPAREAKVKLFEGTPQEAAAALIDALLEEKVL